MSPCYGKILFSLFDILTSYLIYSLCLIESAGNKALSRRCSYLWIYNPLPIVICSRGSSESIILSLVLATLFLAKKKATGLAGIVYGFSGTFITIRMISWMNSNLYLFFSTVHFKLYPIAYCLPLYLCTTQGLDTAKLKHLPLWKNILSITSHRIRLVVGSVLGFFIPTLICYYYYGDEFLQESYYYHLTRKDIRHNFSTYFYMLYLNWNTAGILGTILSILTFAPQVILLITAAVLFRNAGDLCFTIFVQTYCFVIFNKVCTSQYFLWYLSLLPVVYCKLQIKISNALILLFVWYFAQVAWLLPAFFLEFEGRNAFMYVWLESIAFFCANVGILVQIIKNYSP